MHLEVERVFSPGGAGRRVKQSQGYKTTPPWGTVADWYMGHPMEDCEVGGVASSRGAPGAPTAVQSMRCPGGSYNR